MGVRVSPDGRYAGWIDYDGPKRPVGRLAEVVVVDLSTGAEVFRNHDDMGGADDDLDNLYEDAGLGFRGFDDDYVYWQTAEGSPSSKRARIGEWEVEPDPAADPNGPPPPPLAYDTLLGLVVRARRRRHPLRDRRGPRRTRLARGPVVRDDR